MTSVTVQAKMVPHQVEKSVDDFVRAVLDEAGPRKHEELRTFSQ